MTPHWYRVETIKGPGLHTHLNPTHSQTAWIESNEAEEYNDSVRLGVPTPGSADPSDTQGLITESMSIKGPFIVQVTAYRILFTFFITAGFGKAILSYRGFSTSPTTLDWLFGVLFKIGWVKEINSLLLTVTPSRRFYWLGLMENAQPPIC